MLITKEVSVSECKHTFTIGWDGDTQEICCACGVTIPSHPEADQPMPEA